TITTLGCKVNQYESQLARQQLEDSGLQPVALNQQPDLVIVRTCCVTATASSKSRTIIAKACRLSPGATVVAAGCLPVISAEEIRSTGPATMLISDNDGLPDLVNRLICTENRDSQQQTDSIKPENRDRIKNKNHAPGPLLDGTIRAFRGHTRAFLKIQDGCDAHCTYCIIPRIRKTLRSKPEDLVLKEARDLVAAGHKEITLTGIFLGAYNRNTARRKTWTGSGEHLARLIEKVAAVKGLARLRLSSLEPGDVTDELLSVITANPNVAGHLHLPLQSGSDGVLRRMARQYRVADYLRVVDKVRAKLDRPAITTDIIAGFPGETDSEFEETLRLARRIGFARMHVFPFSLRKGTAAERLKGRLSLEIVRRRSVILGKLDTEMQEEFRKQFAGEKVALIVEDETHPAGRCQRYFMVRLQNARGIRRGDMVYATLSPDGCTAIM
ncbi:MAG TPA: tRNA (N(6)-L-threonylcarbamoyladenosine(37)-C(2))-methylthiotransferase MtaB, partial [Sedimentisphaerales bacterium]|nr:tRNA (N(6)-L-threonylcarbamoyladenosine(37)-C(2))-methylthiotransferase MtaB [Sedimentisphaerales bacterium]